MKKEKVIHEWENFCKYLIRKNRYILVPKWKKFADEILSSAAKREQIYPKDTKLWRARVGSKAKIDKGELKVGPLKDKDMGVPPYNKAREGRANPKGIPYFYLACEDRTAIAEVRPYLGKHVTVATFKLTKELKLVDASKEPLTFDFAARIGSTKEISIEDREKLIWAYINTFFSIPIASEDNYCDYIPTQYLSELFKNKRYDGVIYRSAIRQDGCNVVLFDRRAVVIEGKRVVRINKILYEHQEVGIQL